MLVDIDDILGFSGLLAFVLAGNALALLQWLGKLPRGDPDSLLERGYLLLPSMLMFLFLVLFGMVGSLGIEPPRWISWILLAMFVVAVPLGLLGFVLFLWHPDWLRPRWQKEMIAEAKRREQRRAETARTGGRYVLDMVVDGQTKALPAAFDDLEAAEQAARSALQQHAIHDRQAYAAILDSRDDTAVRVVEQA